MPSVTVDDKPRIAPAIEARGVGLTFESRVEALRDVHFSAESGALTSIVGPSGCGKSTLLRLVGGLIEPTVGQIEVGGEPPARGASQSLVFQEPRLLPWRRVARQLSLPLELARLPAPDQAEIDAALARVGLEGFSRSFPHQLSGGMRMRVALARALITSPQLLLLDEPFGALDEITREHLGEELVTLQREANFTALLVTHSVYEAVFLAQRVIVISDRPGRVVASIEVPFAERTPALRADPAFARLCGEVSATLREGGA